MGIVLGPILIAWFIGSWYLAGRMSRSAKWPRLAFLATFLCLLMLPWLDFFAKFAIAKVYQSRDEQMRPASPLVVTGFLSGLNRDQDYPTFAEYFIRPYSFEYVEVEYTRRGSRSLPAGRGFYQFFPAPPGRDRCARTGLSGSRDGILGTAGLCFSFTRTDKPISRYAVEDGEWHSLSFGLRARCRWVVDLHSRADVARTCAYNFGPFWLPDQFGIGSDLGFPFQSGVLESPETAVLRAQQQD
ncbi:MAG: hypothetical protein R3F27_11405 [Gammaproteobacteria bacterium]